MTPLELWRYKVLQVLHDPLHKIAVQGLLRHQDAALRQVVAVIGEQVALPFRAPDRLATGADRPVVGSAKTCRVDWRTSPVVTHPLQPGVRLTVEWDGLPVGLGARREADELDEQLLRALRPLALPSGAWSSRDKVRNLFLRLWRLAPEIVRELGLEAAYLPADSRCPDHSVWDHTRVASAAAYLVELNTKTRPPEREPWMLAFTLGGVQLFLAEARKTRDLWTASMIYADLAWAGMRPIVEALGPDAVLYPDLRGNPVADRWLMRTAGDAVPANVRQTGAISHAAMLPNTFVALVPRGGGASGLPAAEDLARDCAEAVRLRWRSLAGAVKAYFARRVRDGHWQQIWDRQVDARLGEPPVGWVAVPWQRRMHDVGVASRGPALPGHAAGAAGGSRPEQLVSRELSLSPWLPDRVWAHYELARDVFWHADRVAETQYLTAERGFDYPLVHHQLRAALSMRKASRSPRPCDEPGEKCSLTGREEVLHDSPAGDGPLVIRRREGARRFWARFDADGVGAERLGSTASIKRFLVQAAEPEFTQAWESPDEKALRGEREPRVPFPSMAAIATSSFLKDLGAKAGEIPVAKAIEDYVRASERCGLDDTVDPRALPAIARAGGPPAMRKLLAIEPEHLFPETLDVLIRRAGETAQRGSLENFKKAATSLRQAAFTAGITPPGKLVAVLRMDGDQISRLILGDPEVVTTRWEDVLHPKAIEQIAIKLGGTGWTGLLGERRHMGPALHSAITRAHADFSQKMVAWVVECEFNGRLVYAGGDDLLALLPAVEVVPAAARLQQLASAPYVLDTNAEADPWSWRVGGDAGSIELARQRFRVPLAQEGVIRLSERRFEAHAAGDETSSELPAGRVALHTMLGRAHSLSAGIAIGHFKTPIAAMYSTASEMLECEAKGRLERNAIAVTMLVGGGSKAVFAEKWRLAAESDAATGPPEVQHSLQRAVEAFRAPAGKPSLPGRFPYRLRDKLLASSEVLLAQDETRTLVRGLVRVESGLSREDHAQADLLGAVARLVEAGLRLAALVRTTRHSRDERPLTAAEIAQFGVAGLLLARRLAQNRRADGAP